MKLFSPWSFDSFLGDAMAQLYGGFTFSQLNFPSQLSTTCITSDSCTLAFNFPKTKDSPPDLTNVENRLKLVNPAADCFLASLLIELTSPMLPPNAEFFGASNPPEDV